MPDFDRHNVKIGKGKRFPAVEGTEGPGKALSGGQSWGFAPGGVHIARWWGCEHEAVCTLRGAGHGRAKGWQVPGQTTQNVVVNSWVAPVSAAR